MDLRVAGRLPRALCERNRVLPFGSQENAVWVLLPPRSDPVLAQEVAFALGAPVVTWEPSDGNLPQLIEQAFAALERGEERLSPEVAAAADLGEGLVYLEDLGDLGGASGASGGVGMLTLGAPADASAGASGGAGMLTLGGSPGGDGSGATGNARPAPRPAAAAGDSLPDVVDLSSDPDGDVADSGDESEELISEDLDAPLLDVDLLEEDAPASGGASGAAASLEIDRPEEGAASVASPGVESLGVRALGVIGAGAAAAQWSLLLGRIGLPVEPVESAALLLARVRQGPAPGLLVLDGEAEGLQPFDLARQVRALPGGAAPVIAILAPPHLDDWAVARDAARIYGVDLLVATWWGEPMLRAELQRALRERGHGVPSLRSEADLAAARELRRRASERYKAGEVAQAVTLYEAGLALDPGASALQVGLALARVKQRRPDEALVLLERAAALDPGSATTLRSLAVLYEKRGFPTKAMDAWHRVLAITREPAARQAVLERLRGLLDACRPEGSEGA